MLRLLLPSRDYSRHSVRLPGPAIPGRQGLAELQERIHRLKGQPGHHPHLVEIELGPAHFHLRLLRLGQYGQSTLPGIRPVTSD